MRRAITRTAYSPSQWIGVSPDISDAYAALTAAEVSAELAREIVQSAGDRLNGRESAQPRADGPAFQRALTEEISSRFTADATLGRGPAQPRIVALVGPPGSGKTTTLVKLAVNYGLAARRPVLLLSMDTYRVAAADQLRSYAAILGVGFQLLETVVVAGPGDRGKPRQGTDLHRYPGLGLRRSGGFGKPGALSRHARRYRHAPGASGLHEGGRPFAHGGCIRNLAAAASSVHETR